MDKKSNHFMLEVEDPLLLNHLRCKIQQVGHISRGSFSSSLVKRSVDASVALVKDTMKGDHKIAEKVLKDAGAPDTIVKGVIKAACSKLTYQIAIDTGQAAMQQVTDFFEALLRGQADELRTAALALQQRAVEPDA